MHAGHTVSSSRDSVRLSAKLGQHEFVHGDFAWHITDYEHIIKFKHINNYVINQ